SRSMIRSSPFMAQAPVLAAQTTHAVQEWYDLGFHAAETAMVVFGYPNDRFHHIWEAAATAAALVERVVNFRRHDELPRIGIEKLDDRVLDLLLGDHVAVADKHRSTRWAAASRPAGLAPPQRSAAGRFGTSIWPAEACACCRAPGAGRRKTAAVSSVVASSGDADAALRLAAETRPWRGRIAKPAVREDCISCLQSNGFKAQTSKVRERA